MKLLKTQEPTWGANILYVKPSLYDQRGERNFQNDLWGVSRNFWSW